MKFRVFLQKFFNEKLKEKKSLFELFKIEFILRKKDKREKEENKWNDRDRFHYHNSGKVPFFIRNNLTSLSNIKFYVFTEILH